MQFLKSLFLCLLLSLSAAPVLLGQTAAAGATDPVLLRTLQQELERAMNSLNKADPAPYFISYAGNEEFSSIIMASNGALMANIKRHDRTVDVSVRVGSRDLDNTHGENRFNAVTTASLPLEDRPDAIARVLWINTDRMYKKAAQGFPRKNRKFLSARKAFRLSLTSTSGKTGSDGSRQFFPSILT
jgi:hypothetical protein